MPTGTRFGWFWLLVLALSGAACTRSRPPEATPIAPPTPTAVAAHTATEAPAASVGPSPTALPSPTPLTLEWPAAPPVEARIQGELSAQTPQCYRVAGEAQEVLTVAVTGQPAQAVTFQLRAANGALLTQGVSRWEGVLPVAQTLELCLQTTAPAASYQLVVRRTPAVTGPATPEPFPLDANGQGEVRAEIGAGQARTYTLAGRAGHLLQITALPVNSAPLTVAIWGADGTVLLTHEQGQTAWQGLLPRDQNYTLEVRSPQATGFVLRVALRAPTPTPTPAPPPTATPTPTAAATTAAAGQRLSFEPGTQTAQTIGVLAANQQQTFVLYAPAGATMRVILSLDPAGAAHYRIQAADGTVLADEVPGSQIWQGPLPATQDYFITLQAEDQPVYFALRVDVWGGTPTATP